MANTKAIVARFSAALERAYSRPVERIADQVDFDDKYQHHFKAEYDTAMQIITSGKDPELLAALMSALLTLYAKYSKNPNNIHFHRSDQVFYELLDRGKRVPRDVRDVYQEWMAELRSEKASPIRKRYLELGKTYGSLVRNLIEERRRQQSVMDILLDEYFAQHGHAAKTRDDLYGFDPLDETRREAVRQSLDIARSMMRTGWDSSAQSRGSFTHSDLRFGLAAFRGYLMGIAKQGALPLFQVIRYLQEPLFEHREPMRVGTKVTRNTDPLPVEMYAMACIQLLVLAQGKLALPLNRWGFTVAEKEYLLEPIRSSRYEYLSNIEVRFDTRLKDVEAVFTETEAFLELLLVTRERIPDARLVPLGIELRLQRFWEDVDILTNKLKDADDAQKARLLESSQNLVTAQLLNEQLAIEVPISNPELGRGVARVGATPGFNEVFGQVTIVYINPDNHDNFYIEYDGLKPHLFTVQTTYIARKLYSARSFEVHKGTIGVVYLTQAMFLITGFMLVLIEAGFAGLIREIIIYYASSKVEEQASKIHPLFGKIVGFAAMVLAPRPGPKGLKGPAIEQEVPVFSSADAEALQGQRSFKDMLASNEAEGKLIADFNRGTGIKRVFNTAADKFKALREQVSASKAPIEEALPQGELATEGGGMFMTGKSGGGGIGTRGKGGTGVTSTNPNDRYVTALENSEEYQKVQGYSERLDPAHKLEARQAVNAAKAELRAGKLTLVEAKQKIVNVLNAAKEATGEYTADVIVLSNYERVEFIEIPVRKNGVPMLDRVYKVKSYGQRGSKYLVVEVKGGINTRLGEVTRKEYEVVSGEVVMREFPKQMVKQASGEWYYQKMMEIYMADPRRNAALVRDMFASARNGEIESAIIKSGQELERARLLVDTNPRIKYNTDEITVWFRNRELPFDAKLSAAAGARGRRTFP
ncbi:MAG: hypothetical protein WBV82_00620 [Myxococcaceae bacterium]